MILTGGVRSKRRVSVYTTQGWLEDWPSLHRSRIQHGCGHYVNSEDKMVSAMVSCNVMMPLSHSCPQVYLVVGGYLTASTELLTEGAAAWTFAGPVPLASWISVVSIHNNVISTGGVSLTQLIELYCEIFLAKNILCTKLVANLLQVSR